MALLKWSSEYSVGVKTLDDQHAAYLALLNELHSTMMKGQANEAAGPMLKRLVLLIHDHVSTEESLLESTKYPELPRHRSLHQGLNRQLDEYMARVKLGERAVYPDLLRFMRDWLGKHILEEDQKYAPWLRTHGAH